MATAGPPRHLPYPRRPDRQPGLASSLPAQRHGHQPLQAELGHEPAKEAVRQNMASWYLWRGLHPSPHPGRRTELKHLRTMRSAPQARERTLTEERAPVAGKAALSLHWVATHLRGQRCTCSWPRPSNPAPLRR